jgi:hypothetical protein
MSLDTTAGARRGISFDILHLSLSSRVYSNAPKWLQVFGIDFRLSMRTTQTSSKMYSTGTITGRSEERHSALTASTECSVTQMTSHLDYQQTDSPCSNGDGRGIQPLGRSYWSIITCILNTEPDWRMCYVLVLFPAPGNAKTSTRS